MHPVITLVEYSSTSALRPGMADAWEKFIKVALYKMHMLVSF